MNTGTIIRQRDIILVPFLLYSNLRDCKLRPAVIISDNRFNESNDDVICCAVTSNPKESSLSVLIANCDLESGILNKESRVKSTKLFTLEKKIIQKVIAQLNIPKSKEVVALLNNCIAIQE